MSAARQGRAVTAYGHSPPALRSVDGAQSLPPIIFPGRPERWWGDEALKAEADPPQATLKQRHQAAGDILALRRRGFFRRGFCFRWRPTFRLKPPNRAPARDPG